MVQLIKLFAATVLATLGFSELVSSHPGETHHAESAEVQVQRQQYFAESQRALAACAKTPHGRRLQEEGSARRAALVDKLRADRKLSAATVIATNHKSSLIGVSPATDPTVLFGSTPKCVLEPYVTEGPYYVRGELIRTDIREKQAGIDLYTELQIIDVNTCLPVPNLYIDFWHCNSTGVYSGVNAATNGNYADKSNINKTFNRGLAPTNASGLVTFLTTFPGHYTGRTTHIHVLANHDGKVLANNTYSGGSVSHVGQIFFDQSLITQVEQTSAYLPNKQTLTTNARDSIFAQSAATFDPVVNYVYLGNSVTDGIFSWISIGINAKLSRTVSAAAHLTANGGVAN
uniref:Intradiol ring-cleavage dioxygenases domain-containing protein n=1 Tax=Globisporangium ultimum (strain ATCC 200006 / CBS 805.95 / DAOM BR144) TaxID=431595 RepID=K3XB85_GLOUD